jgi:3'-phosphoadenosine 5'-phosphosulfate sulfotransferase (PAPS reductase)/FAD synthetase
MAMKRLRPKAHVRKYKDGHATIVNPEVRRKAPLPRPERMYIGQPGIGPLRIKGRENKQKGPKKHIVCFSGGKDSSAMLLRMIELKMPIDRILFCDTGKEFPALYQYVKRMSDYTYRTIGVPVETLKPGKTWDDWFYGPITRGKRMGQLRGWPLLAFHCWWSREAKFNLMDPICTGNYRYIGFGADETKRLRQSREKEGYRFPLADWGWSEKDALEYLKKRGWAEQFHLDFDRTGCYFCPKQGEKSLRTLARKYPREWDELMRYAKDAATNPRFASKDFNPQINYEKLKQIEKEERGKR